MKGPNKRRIATRSTVIAALLLALGNAFADEVLEEESTFEIPDQPLDQALLEFSKQADVQIIMAAETARGLDAEAIHGTQSNRDALEQLLADRGLEYSEHSNRTIAVHRTTAVAGEGGDSDSGNRAAAGASMAMAQSQTGVQQSLASQPNKRESEREERPIEEIVVTGTSIRGIAPESSPTRIFTREDVQVTGAATAQDFIQTLPSNFGGGSNADTGIGLPNDSNAQFNGPNSGGTLGSSVNLRGLGSGSTLVLLNGHRLAPSSGIGDFVDISMIPASAIDRVEVLSDGASSIYGSDAVAGVVNFVLRDDYDGVEASLRYGTATEGDMDEYRASLTGGTNWESGSALFIYEYFDQDSLSAAERSFSDDAGQPTTLLPSQERHSVLGSLRQELSPDVDVFADVIFSTRDATLSLTTLGTSTVRTSSADNLAISAGGSWRVLENWHLDISGTYSNAENDAANVGLTDTGLREVNSDLWTVDAVASGDLFTLPGGIVKLALGGQFRPEDFTNTDVDEGIIDRRADRDIYAFFGEVFIPIIGPDNAIPGIERLEINASGRVDDFDDFGTTTNPKVGVLWAPFVSLNIRGSYSTSFNPPRLGRVGAADLVASAVPSSSFNAAFGLTPGDPSIADVVMITVFGTDSNLTAENSRTFSAGFDFTKEEGAHQFNASATFFDIEFRDRLGATPIPDNRIVFDAQNIAFNNPELFPEGTISFFPPQSEITEVLASLDEPINVFPGLDPLDAAIINRAAVVRNLANTFVTGVDFDIEYSLNAEIGEFTAGVDGAILIDFQQQAFVTTPIVEQIDTLYNPVDLRMRGRLGFSGKKGLTANIFVNYTDNYRIDNSADAARVDSWTTVDASVSYNTNDRFDSSLINNTSLRVSVINLFNEKPPETPSFETFGIFGFDPTNASPLGRFVSVDFIQRF